MAMAGVQGLEISTFDEPFRTPSAIAHQLAIRTQQVIQAETNIGAVEDPLGGSYYVESLTDELGRRIDAAVRQVEELGDVDTLVESGYFRRILPARWTGIPPPCRTGSCGSWELTSNHLTGGRPVPARHCRRALRAGLRARRTIRSWRASRADAPLQASLERVRDASADPDADLMGPIVAALDADATIGEITGCLRGAWGCRATRSSSPPGASRPGSGHGRLSGGAAGRDASSSAPSASTSTRSVRWRSAGSSSGTATRSSTWGASTRRNG